MSGTRRSRVTPSITNKPTCGGSKKYGLPLTWGKSSTISYRNSCKKTKTCFPQLRCCPTFLPGGNCQPALTLLFNNYVSK